MKSVQYLLLTTLLCVSYISVKAQIQRTGNKEDSIAQMKVIELLESKHVLDYYDENINTPGDFIYSSQVETMIRKMPGKDFNNYWIQVMDHSRYEGSGVFLNFYVDPKNNEVLYFDPESNLTWTWEQWTRQYKYSKL